MTMGQNRFIVARTVFARLRTTPRTLSRRVLPAGLAIVIAYAAYPYLVLFQLGQAIRQGDAATLERLVDWDGVREGLKEDVCDDVTETPPALAQAVRSGDTLPPFGYSFVRGITGNMIDENVTAAALLAAAAPARQRADEWPRIDWAFFEDATHFAVRLRPADPGMGAIRIMLELQDSHWKVVRAWLPHDLLMRANTRI
jgi:hypothetical protein